MYNEILPIVIDNGSGYMKAGYAGYDTPHCVFSTLVGRLTREPSVLEYKADGGKKVFIGDEVETYKGVLEVSRPMQNGRIVDVDSLEMIWGYILDQKLKWKKETQPIILTGTPSKNAKMRQQTLERMFEKLDVQAISIQAPHLLALYGVGFTTGVVFDCGENESYAASTYDGFSITTSTDTARVGVCGDDLTQYLTQLLTKKGTLFSEQSNSMRAQGGLVRDIKEKLCYVSQDIKAEREYCRNQTMKGRNYELPDGTIIEITTPLFECPEALFKPALLGMSNEKLSVHQLLHEIITEADINLRRQLANAVILVGGSTLFQGLEQRVGKELSRLCPESMTVTVTAPPGREYVSWTGGSIIGSLSSFNSHYITKDAFLECGFHHMDSRYL